MQISDLLIDENATVKEVVERLERVRCKVVYVVDNGKLVASVSDGDVRRYAHGSERVIRLVQRTDKQH